MKRSWLLLLVISFTFYGCQNDDSAVFTELEVATKWAELTTYITHYSFGNTPTYASRAFGYIGLTMYESIVHGYPEYQTLAGQLSGLDTLPSPKTNQEYDWLIALNAGQAEILRNIYHQTPDKNKLKIDSVEQLIFKSISKNSKNKKIIKSSESLGKEIALAIFEWSKSDGGHKGYLQNFDKSFVHPVFPGSWQPPLYAQSFSHHPLHPHWGKNRTFIPKNSEIPLPEMIPYSQDTDSDYYKEFLAVYEQEKKLTQQDKEVAIWWGDDPDETFTPPGHSYHIATLAIKHFNPTLIKCAETYARVGMATADAFTNCWKWKYHFFSERPNTFIPQNIDQEWESFWPDPPFPSFPSGHAIQAAASATALIDLYGDEFSFTDASHVGRKRDELRDVDFKARSFTNFWDVALETAQSRFYGGIHTNQDNEVGLKEGKRIAEHVNGLNWKID